MEQPRDLSTAIAHANLLREQEPIRVLGWLALGIGIFCWLIGWMFLIYLPNYTNYFGSSRDPTVAAIFAAGAGLGLILAICVRRVGGKIIRHSIVAAVVNGLLLVVALVRVIQWTVTDEPPTPTPSSYPTD